MTPFSTLSQSSQATRVTLGCWASLTNISLQPANKQVTTADQLSRMRLMSLSLYAAIWLTSTAFALIARPLNLQPGANKASKYPEGYNAQTCPFGSPTVLLMGSPARSETLARPTSAPAAPKSAMTRRVPPPAEAQICRQISQLSFTGADYRDSYDRHTFEVMTGELPPGLYAIVVVGNRRIRGISVAEYYSDAVTPPTLMNEIVRNNPANSLGIVVRLDRAAVLHSRIRYATTDTVGEVILFELDPDGFRAASERAGLYGPRRLRR